MKKTLLFTILFGIFLVSAFAVYREDIDASDRPTLVPDEIIIKYHPSVTILQEKLLQGKYGLTKKAGSYKKGDFVVFKHKNPPGVLDLLKKEPGIVYAERNGYAYMATSPTNDQYYPYQWNLVKINMPASWDISRGAGVVVAVLDTGVKQDLPDFAGNRFTAGYDFVNRDNEPTDDQGHGSHVAGIIAQATNNNSGVAGIAYECTVMPVKVLNSAGRGTYDQIADGIRYAVDNGAQILNLSLGGIAVSTTLQNAVDYAWNKNCLIVCAAGNDAAGTPFYPASYTNSFSAAATNYNDGGATYSNYGDTVDISAPGGDDTDWNGCGYPEGILQGTFGVSGDGYYFYCGTSMASAHVAGVAALLKSQDPARTNSQIRGIIEASAVDLGSAGWDATFGWGRIDAHAALTYTSPRRPGMATPLPAL